MKLTQLFDHWEQVRSGLLATMDEFSDDELSFIPFEPSWSVGQIMLHIAGAEEGWFRYVIGREYDEWPPGYSLADYPDVGSIKALLTEVYARTEAYLDTQTLADLERMIDAPWGKSIPQSWIIWHVLEHEIHHRGELSLILGLLGREGLDV
ncbi:MAG TPA: DinB family protein [Anaerolineales bacterium]|nr:DinB family protein [Anaerolineales bacterium]